MPHSTTPPNAGHPPSAPAATPPDRSPGISSADLLGTANTLRIEHKGAVYTLRATSKGGLILTK